MAAVIYFNTFNVSKQVFYKSKYTYALVNIKPLCPGHVLVVPYRVIPRFKELTHDESIDYMETLQKISTFIEHIYKADSLNLAIQDGAAAGQSMPHLHTHIIPRYFADKYQDDKIHGAIDDNEKKLSQDFDKPEIFNVPDSERKARTVEVMAAEADWLREELEKFEQSNKN